MTYTPDTPITGGSRPLTPAAKTAIVAAIAARPNGAYDAADIRTIVLAYDRCCELAGMDPLPPIAQCLHETGWLSSWWSERPRRNPAGIGVTGRSSANTTWRMRDGRPIGIDAAERHGIWIEGCSFPSWANHAVPAHVGRLLAYALRPETGTPAQQQLVRVALIARPLSQRLRGVAPTWRGLNGRWAVPGTDYADKVAAIANHLWGES